MRRGSKVQGEPALADRGWRWIAVAAIAAAALAAVGAIVAVAGSSPDTRLAYGLALGGVLALRMLAAFGVGQRAAWAVVCGALLAGWDVLTVVAVTLVPANVAGLQFQESLATLALYWAMGGVGAAFLTGVGMLVRARRG